MKITQEDLDLWVNALLSGKYKQGKGKLNIDNKEFCCLGVLCEVFAEKGILERFSYPEKYTVRYLDPLYEKSGEGRSGQSALSPKMGKMFDCNLLGPIVEEKVAGGWKSAMGDDTEYPIAILNDNGYTFPEIAEILKKIAVIVPNYEIPAV